MTENMENMEQDTLVAEQVEEPKTYSQDEVDNIVKSRLAREKVKNKSLKAENDKLAKSNRSYRILSEILDKKGGFKGDPDKQLEHVRTYYKLSDSELEQIKENVDYDPKSEKQTMAYFNAKRFVEQSDPDEIQEEYERIKDIPEERRSLSDKELFRQIKPHSADEVKKSIDADKEWFEQNVGGDFLEFLRSEEFAGFMDGTGLSVRKGMEKFVKLKGSQAVKTAFQKSENSGKKPTSAGSAKDSGASELKEYYSPEDVDRLSDKDLDNPEIVKRIRQSMTKWK